MSSTNNPAGNVDPSENTIGGSGSVDPSENTIGGGAQAMSAAEADANAEEMSAQEKDTGSADGAISVE